MLVCFFVRQVLCIMVAASHCSCFSQCVGRGQGSAAGVAEDRMTCMLVALKCMGLMGRFWEDVHHLLCAIWYFGVCFGKKGCVHAVWYLDLHS